MLAKSTADVIDATLTKAVPDLVAAQEAYFNAPVGADQDAKPILRQKYQQTKPVTDANGVTTEVHEYDGPLGKGYILHAWITKAEVLYHKQQDFGPEGRDKDWQIAE